jgi:4-amino-4-deoxy-L-arabinose transferase-like glycosyltransferase
MLFTAILFCAVFFRSYQLTSTPPGLFYDEAMDGNNAVEAAETNHFQVFYVEDNGREGLYVNLLALILKVLPVYEPWIVRLPAAVAGVLTVWGLYLFATEVFGDAPGLLAAYLLAASFWHIDFSRTGFRAILAPLMLPWALWLLIKGLRVQDSGGWPRWRAAMTFTLLAGIVYGLGFYTYIAYRVTPFLLLLLIPFFRKAPGFWKRAVLFLVVACLVAAPIGWYFLQHPGDFFRRTAEVSVMSAAHPVYRFAANTAKTALMFNFHGDNNWRLNIAGAPELFWPVGIIFLLGILLAVQALWRRRRKRAASDLFPSFGILFIFLWFVLGGLPAVASNEGIPHALRSILLLPSSMIFAALGGVWLNGMMQRFWNVYAVKAIAIVFLLAVGVFGYYDYFIVWARNPQVPLAFNAGNVDIGRQINALPAGMPKYVVVPPIDDLARGLPIPAETTIFMTHSFTAADREAANIHYLWPDQIGRIPAGTPSRTIFHILGPDQ